MFVVFELEEPRSPVGVPGLSVGSSGRGRSAAAELKEGTRETNLSAASAGKPCWKRESPDSAWGRALVIGESLRPVLLDEFVCTLLAVELARTRRESCRLETRSGAGLPSPSTARFFCGGLLAVEDDATPAAEDDGGGESCMKRGLPSGTRARFFDEEETDVAGADSGVEAAEARGAGAGVPLEPLAAVRAAHGRVRSGRTTFLVLEPEGALGTDGAEDGGS